MNSSISNLSAQQLRRAADLKERIDGLQNEFNKMLGGEISAPQAKVIGKKRKISAAGKAAISEAAKARWAKIRGNGGSAKEKGPKRKLSAAGLANIRAGVAKRMAQKAGAALSKPTAKRTMSAAGRARLSAMAKARWKKARAQGKGTL
jgi:hypothetical protein